MESKEGKDVRLLGMAETRQARQSSAEDGDGEFIYGT